MQHPWERYSKSWVTYREQNRYAVIIQLKREDKSKDDFFPNWETKSCALMSRNRLDTEMEKRGICCLMNPLYTFPPKVNSENSLVQGS